MYVYVCVLYRSKDATEEMEALVKAQNNPDEIELDEEGDEEEAMVQGEVKGGKRDNADALRGEKKGVTRVIVPNSPLNCSREVGGVCVDVAVAPNLPVLLRGGTRGTDRPQGSVWGNLRRESN